jgi:hypothetical protein
MRISYFLLSLLMYSGILFGQNQITLTMGDPTNVTATSFEFKIFLANTGSSTLKLSAAQPQIFQTGTSVPVSPTPLYSLVSEGSTFTSLNNPTPSYNNSTFRLAQSPIGAAASAVLIPNTATEFATVRITSNGGPITYPVTLNFRTSTPNTTLSAYVDASTTTTTFSLANNNLVNGPSLEVAAPLPVDLVYFRARATGATNLIEWITASELNNAWHIVERSTNGTDNWEQIGKVGGAGTSSDQHSYQLEDRQPLAQSYYRLRSVDFDGQEERSNVVMVSRRSGIFGVTGAYPSPTSDRVSVQFESMEETAVTIQMFDFNGRLVLQQEVLADKGVNLSEVDMSSLQAGTYTVHLLSIDNISAQVKVVKQ